LRNSRKVGARFISAIVAARAKQVKLRREYLHEVRITERELGVARRS
jgi:hypothetical protein